MIWLVVFCSWQTTKTAMAFSVTPATRYSRGMTLSHLYMANPKQHKKEQEEKHEAIECFIVNFFEVQEEDAVPHVVCTAHPEEYAWYNGIDRDAMKETDGILEGALECVEGASPRGHPEWECRTTLTESCWQ